MSPIGVPDGRSVVAIITIRQGQDNWIESSSFNKQRGAIEQSPLAIELKPAAAAKD